MNLAHTLTGIGFMVACLTAVILRFDSIGWGVGVPYLPIQQPRTFNELIIYVEHKLNDRIEAKEKAANAARGNAPVHWIQARAD